jgi:hypothetical protein
MYCTYNTIHSLLLVVNYVLPPKIVQPMGAKKNHQLFFKNIFFGPIAGLGRWYGAPLGLPAAPLSIRHLGGVLNHIFVVSMWQEKKKVCQTGGQGLILIFPVGFLICDSILHLKIDNMKMHRLKCVHFFAISTTICETKVKLFKNIIKWWHNMNMNELDLFREIKLP